MKYTVVCSKFQPTKGGFLIHTRDGPIFIGKGAKNTQIIYAPEGTRINRTKLTHAEIFKALKEKPDATNPTESLEEEDIFFQKHPYTETHNLYSTSRDSKARPQPGE